jgi:centromeric protein E
MKESHEEAIRVAVRVRPHTAEEETQRPWTVKDNSITFSLVTPAVSWKFDHVFDETSSNGDIYTKQAAPIVESVMNGINGTIFAYGQTSSGENLR